MAKTQAARPAKGRAIHVKNTDTTALRQEYVSWLLDPDREPRTQQQWAKDRGLTPETVSRWKQDEFVLGLLRRANELMEPMWARALATLVKVAVDVDHPQCVQAIRELGKLLRKYPSEKHDITVIDKVAYVQPGALRELSAALEARPN